ncbi:MAG: hypothetical protein ACRCVW_05310 [Brevinema sp.]
MEQNYDVSSHPLSKKFLKKKTEQDYSVIITEMTILERVLKFFYTLFTKEKLLDFYIYCGMKHIEHKLSKNSLTWYHKEQKSLDIEFADTLFHLVRSLDVLAPLMTDVMFESKTPQDNNQIPQMIEVIFHAIHTRQSIQTYTFSELRLINLFQGVSPSDILYKKESCVQEYLDQISPEEWNRIDRKYSDLIGMIRLIDLPLLEFLRRFSFDISIHADLRDVSWNFVTITAVDSYLEMLYDVIDNLSFTKDDIEIIKSLNTSNKFLNNPSSSLNAQDIVFACEEFIDALHKFKKDDTLYYLLCLSKKNPVFSSSNNNFSYSIEEKFSNTLKKRVYSASNILIENIFVKKNQELLELIVLKKHESFIDFGVYNIDNNKKIERISSEKLNHVFVITAIYVFVLDIAQPWLKNFLGFLMVNAEFTDKSSIAVLESIYKKMNKFLIKFDSFFQETAIKSPSSNRLQKFLDINNNKLTDDQVRLLKIFLDSMNSQATILVSLFNELISEFIGFIESLSQEFKAENQKFITNILAIKKLMNKSEFIKIHDFYVFCQNVKRLIELESLLNMSRNSKED